MAVQKVGTNIIDSSYTTSITTNPIFSGTGSTTVPTGTTAQRPTSPTVGMIRYNTTLDSLEQYTTVGWAAIAPPPIVTSISPTTYNGEQGTTITVNGSNFTSGASVRFIDNAGTSYTATTTSFVNSNQLTATTPQDFMVSQQPFDVVVVNPSGLANTLADCLDCGGSPSWTTASGNLDTKYEGESVSATIAATDPDAGATISYSAASGLPSGVTINSSTGVISGTAPTNISNDTTYSFNAVASDNAGNTATRSFSIIIKNDPILDITTLGAYDGTSASAQAGSAGSLSLNQITANYTTGLSSITGGTWRGTGVFRLPVSSTPGNWNNVVGNIPTSGGFTICWWGKLDGSIQSSNNAPRPIDFYTRTNEFYDFNRNTYTFNFSGGSVNARTITSNSSWSLFDWHFFCVRYSVSPVSTSSQTQTITVDNAGTLYSGSFTCSKSSNSGSYSGFMGYAQTNGNDYAWEGYTGGWRMFNKNCTDAEVTALYNAGKGYFRP